MIKMPNIPAGKLEIIRDMTPAQMERDRSMWRWIYKPSPHAAPIYNQPCHLLRDFAPLMAQEDAGRAWLERFLYYYTPKQHSLKYDRRDLAAYAAWGCHGEKVCTIKRNLRSMAIDPGGYLVPPCQDIDEAATQCVAMLKSQRILSIDSILFMVAARAVLINDDMFGYPANTIVLEETWFEAVQKQKIYTMHAYDSGLDGWTISAY
jgi:hypothetical protein